MAGGPSRKKQGQAGATGMSNGWRQKQTAVAMPRATCPPPRSLSSLAPSTARHEAYCRSNLRTHVLRHWKTSPQNLRPSTPPSETLLPVNCSLSPLSFYLARSSSAQLLALPAAATGSAARAPSPGAWECRRTPRQPRTEMHHHGHDRKLVGRLSSRS